MNRLLPFLLLCVAACADQRPPAPTAEESERLDQADAMLDEAANAQSAQ